MTTRVTGSIKNPPPRDWDGGFLYIMTNMDPEGFEPPTSPL